MTSLIALVVEYMMICEPYIIASSVTQAPFHGIANSANSTDMIVTNQKAGEPDELQCHELMLLLVIEFLFFPEL